jgi:hypothetical protein
MHAWRPANQLKPTCLVGIQHAILVDAFQPLLAAAQTRALVLAESQAHILAAALQSAQKTTGVQAGWAKGSRSGPE